MRSSQSFDIYGWRAGAGGALQGQEWHADGAAWAEATGHVTANSLRDDIVKDLRDNNIVMIRSHNRGA
jgi:hypothetical protein